MKIAFDMGELGRALRALSLFMCDDNTRLHLHRIEIEVNRAADKNRVMLLATDGHRLAGYMCEHVVLSADAKSTHLDYDTVKAMAKLLKPLKKSEMFGRAAVLDNGNVETFMATSGGASLQDLQEAVDGQRAGTIDHARCMRWDPALTGDSRTMFPPWRQVLPNAPDDAKARAAAKREKRALPDRSVLCINPAYLTQLGQAFEILTEGQTIPMMYLTPNVDPISPTVCHLDGGQFFVVQMPMRCDEKSAVWAPDIYPGMMAPKEPTKE